MNIQRRFLIVSVFLTSENEETNKHNHKTVVQRFKDKQLAFIELQGKYNGIPEQSLLIDGFEYRALVERLAKEYSQESYLESHSDGSTFLIFTNGSKEFIGQFLAISPEEAQASGSYSYNPHTKQYFGTRKIGA